MQRAVYVWSSRFCLCTRNTGFPIDPDLSCDRVWLGPAVCGVEFRAALAEVFAQARRMDGTVQCLDGISHAGHGHMVVYLDGPALQGRALVRFFPGDCCPRRLGIWAICATWTNQASARHGHQPVASGSGLRLRIGNKPTLAHT